jgi:hypothetical protein
MSGATSAALAGSMITASWSVPCSIDPCMSSQTPVQGSNLRPWDEKHPSARCCRPPAIRENASITNAKDPSPSRAPTACSAVQTFSTTSRER